MEFRDTYGNIISRKVGDRIIETYGSWKFEIRGDRLYDTFGNWLGSEY